MIQTLARNFARFDFVMTWKDGNLLKNWILSDALSIVQRGARLVSDRREAQLLNTAYGNGAAHIQGAQAFAGLLPVSLSLASIQSTAESAPSINLVLPELRPAGIFAGLRTALEFGVKLALASGRRIRIITARNGPKQDERRVIVDLLVDEYGLLSATDVDFASGTELVNLKCQSDDAWVVTHWTTAHSVEVACRLGQIDSNKVFYLIQDYEAGFYPWSSSYALARATYKAGFQPVVNSSPLREFLSANEGLEVDRDLTFAPSLDLRRLEEASRNRIRGGPLRVMFYSRPSKPRNLFDIGVAALKIAATEFADLGLDISFVSAGESHPTIALSKDHTLLSMGKLSWDEYFKQLANVDVVLSLQHSPHPSHPPLDAVSSGAIAVTNELGGTRAGLHPRLLVAEPDPVSLGRRIVDGARLAESNRSDFEGDFIATMGLPIDVVVLNAAARLAKR
jgi:O-antigen biosynthesis protein